MNTSGKYELEEDTIEEKSISYQKGNKKCLQVKKK